MTYVIAGNGPAAANAAISIRERDTGGRIVMVSPENNPPYTRIAVPELLSGEAERENIFWLGEDFYGRLDIETRLGRFVAGIEPQSHTAVLDDGERIAYDRLLIATGARPFLPDWANNPPSGVHGLWKLGDADAIAAELKSVRRAVIVGGGLVGLQGARALAALDIPVTVVEIADRLMPQQVDETASGMLRSAAESAGVTVTLSTAVESLSAENGRVSGVRLAGGGVLPADLVLVCAGVRPNLAMLDGLEIAHERGVEVNDCLCTSLPDVYAAGDVAVAPLYLGGGEKACRAIWPNAVEQGRLAGIAMTGGAADYTGARTMNSIELFGLTIVSTGAIAESGDVRATVLNEPVSGCYRKIMRTADGKLAGFLFAGDINGAGSLLAKLGQSESEGFFARIPSPEPEMMRV